MDNSERVAFRDPSDTEVASAVWGQAGLHHSGEAALSDLSPEAAPQPWLAAGEAATTPGEARQYLLFPEILKSALTFPDQSRVSSRAVSWPFGGLTGAETVGVQGWDLMQGISGLNNPPPISCL